MSRWGWLVSDAGLAFRIAIGGGIFAILAAVDFIRHGRQATRWREYAFLIAAVGCAMLYGAINDAIASRISWEYFYYGKDVKRLLGPTAPPDATALTHAAVALGLRATWTAGLLIGAILLMANNPKPGRRPVPYGVLALWVLVIAAVAAFTALLGAAAGFHGYLNWTNADLAGIWRENLFRPPRFLTVYGMNLGGYAGGALGTAAAVIWIRRVRRQS